MSCSKTETDHSKQASTEPGSDLVARALNVQGDENLQLQVLELARDNARLIEQLTNSERLIALGQIASGVGHEVNNQLLVLSGNADYICESLLAEIAAGRGRSVVGDLRAVMREIRESVARIGHIASDLLRLARRDEDEPTAIELAGAIESAVRVARPYLQHDARVVLRLDRDLIVRATATRLSQVFVNLLINAGQAIASDPGDGPEILITSRVAEGFAIVEVSDNGPGIAGDVIGRIFEPFFTTKPVGTGSGLGLSLSRDTLRRLGGDLRASSQPGCGATFSARIPLVEHAGAISGPGRDLVRSARGARLADRPWFEPPILEPRHRRRREPGSQVTSPVQLKV